MTEITRDDLYLSYKKTYDSHLNKILKSDKLDEELLESLIDFLYDFKNSYKTDILFLCINYKDIIKDLNILKEKFHAYNLKYLISNFKNKRLNPINLYSYLYNLFVLNEPRLDNKLFIDMYLKYHKDFQDNVLNSLPDKIFILNHISNSIQITILNSYNISIEYKNIIDKLKISYTKDDKTNTFKFKIEVKTAFQMQPQTLF